MAKDMLSGVGRWNIDRGALILLSSVLFIIFLILVLPQVDLLDTAFQRDTAPVVVHSQATGSPVFQSILARFVPAAVTTAFRSRKCWNAFSPTRSDAPIAILLEPLRC